MKCQGCRVIRGEGSRGGGGGRGDHGPVVHPQRTQEEDCTVRVCEQDIRRLSMFSYANVRAKIKEKTHPNKSITWTVMKLSNSCMYSSQCGKSQWTRALNGNGLGKRAQFIDLETPDHEQTGCGGSDAESTQRWKQNRKKHCLTRSRKSVLLHLISYSSTRTS